MRESEAQARAEDSLELVRLAQGGEYPALNQLFTRYYERVRRVVRMRLGRRLRMHMDSGDILQETFIKAVNGFDGFQMRDEASLIHWLSKIAENQIKDAMDHHRALKRDSDREIALPNLRAAQASGDLTYDPSGDGPLPLDELVKDEDTGILEACMDNLRVEYREVLLMREYEGASWADIAAWTNTPTANAARMLHARAVTELARQVRLREQGSGSRGA